jgi:hypothetical protein
MSPRLFGLALRFYLEGWLSRRSFGCPELEETKRNRVKRQSGQFREFMRMRFQGEFRPPMMGTDKHPVQVTGLGSLEITDSGLVVDGYRVKGLGAGTIGILFILFVFGCMAISIKMDLDIHSNSYFYPGLAVISFFALKGRKRAQGDPWKFVIPWQSVKLVRAADGAIEFLIEKSEPNGKVFFYPTEDHQSLVEELKKDRS